MILGGGGGGGGGGGAGSSSAHLFFCKIFRSPAFIAHIMARVLLESNY